MRTCGGPSCSSTVAPLDPELQETFTTALRRRFGLLLNADVLGLIQEARRRTPRPTAAPTLTTMTADARRAARAQAAVEKKHSIRGAVKELRAIERNEPTTPAMLTAAMQILKSELLLQYLPNPYKEVVIVQTTGLELYFVG